MRIFLILFSLISLSACSRVAFKVDDKIKAMDTGVLSGPPPINTGGGVTPTTPGGGGTIPDETNPVVTTPGVTTPVVTTPVVTTPVVTTPVVTDPGVTTPVVTTPVITPVVTTPVVTTPVVTDPGVTTPTIDPGVTNPGVTNPGVTNPGVTTPDVPTTVATPTPTPAPLVGDLVLPVTRHCSDFKTLDLKENINHAQSVYAVVKQNGVTQCTINNTSLIKTSVNAGQLPLIGCSLSDGTYNLDVVADGKSMVVGLESNTKGNDTFTVLSGAVVSSDISLLLDSNPEVKLSLKGYPKHMPGVQCDVKASPLFVDFRKDSTDYDILSSPQDGVMFDILGERGGYKKSQISWFEKGRFGLLALPDANGQVNNIDQLFGDNTKGPDGAFASNGFTALAKHDSNGDQVIDRFDNVFSKLRLWFDFNRDGRADRRELKTLDEMKLVAIDLQYDAGFREVDKYGNELKYKSVVKFKSGRLRSIFDVWFAIGD